MSRGFITIATGKEHYYKIAANLLLSYRYYSAEPEPFAIIADRKNQYTDLFDLVIILEDPCCSYVDKLRLPELVPFDETIFIDADCLAYKDLNTFWDLFQDADTFSCFGRNYPPDYKYGWFLKKDMGIYQERVQYVPDFIGGVYYLRKTDELEVFYELVKQIIPTYHDYRFRQFEEVSDETVYALAMSVCGFRTVGEKSPDICFYPHITYFDSDITSGKVKYNSIYLKKRGIIPEAYMVHWGSGNTYRLPYLLEEYRLHRICAGKTVSRAGLKTEELKIKTKKLAGKAYRKMRQWMQRS